MVEDMEQGKPVPCILPDFHVIHWWIFGLHWVRRQDNLF